MQNLRLRLTPLVLVFSLLVGFVASPVFAQSKPQRVEPRGNDKRNQRPTPKTPEELKAEEE